MFFEYVISAIDKMVSVKFAGETDFEKGVQHLMEVVADKNFQREYSIVVDVREMNYHPNFSEMRAFADVLTELKEKCTGKTALVVGSFIHYTIGKVLAGWLHAAGITFQVFRDYNEAATWTKELAKE
jgi:hypothetical protein